VEAPQPAVEAVEPEPAAGEPAETESPEPEGVLAEAVGATGGEADAADDAAEPESQEA
jgi:hypothetical protein